MDGVFAPHPGVLGILTGPGRCFAVNMLVEPTSRCAADVVLQEDRAGATLTAEALERLGLPDGDGAEASAAAPAEQDGDDDGAERVHMPLRSCRLELDLAAGAEQAVQNLEAWFDGAPAASSEFVASVDVDVRGAADEAALGAITRAAERLADSWSQLTWVVNATSWTGHLDPLMAFAEKHGACRVLLEDDVGGDLERHTALGHELQRAGYLVARRACWNGREDLGSFVDQVLESRSGSVFDIRLAVLRRGASGRYEPGVGAQDLAGAPAALERAALRMGGKVLTASEPFRSILLQALVGQRVAQGWTRGAGALYIDASGTYPSREHCLAGLTRLSSRPESGYRAVPLGGAAAAGYPACSDCVLGCACDRYWSVGVDLAAQLEQPEMARSVARYECAVRSFVLPVLVRELQQNRGRLNTDPQLDIGIRSGEVTYA